MKNVFKITFGKLVAATVFALIYRITSILSFFNFSFFGIGAFSTPGDLVLKGIHRTFSIPYSFDVANPVFLVLVDVVFAYLFVCIFLWCVSALWSFIHRD